MGDPAYNPGLVRGYLTGALASWSLKKSRHAVSTKSLGRLFHRPTLSGKKACWDHKVHVHGAWNVTLLDVGACVRWSETGMSTRLWTIQYRMVTRAVARRSSKGSQPIRSSIAENTTGYNRSLPGLSPLCVGPIPHLSIQGFVNSSSQLVLGASYAGGKHNVLAFFSAWWTCGDHNVSSWRNTLVYLAVGLLFPILYHILKFISVSLGTDFSIMRQSSAISLMCDGSTRWGRSLIYTRNNNGPSTVPCGEPEVTGLVCDDFPSSLSLIPVIEKWSDPSKGTAIDGDYLGSFSKRRCRFYQAP